MLEFVFDCIKRYIPDDCYEFIEMDTDSLYLSLCSNSLDDVVKPELREKFFENYDYFFPSLACEHHKKEFIKTRVQNLEWVQGDCCKTRELFDKRTPGLLKLEFFGSQMLALVPKTCISEKEVLQGGESDNNQTIKKACKGLSTKLNKFNFDTYLDVLETKRSGVGVNKGFVCKNHQVFTYTQKRSGLGFFMESGKFWEMGFQQPLLIFNLRLFSPRFIVNVCLKLVCVFFCFTINKFYVLCYSRLMENQAILTSVS